MAKGIINYLCRCIPGITIILWAVICWEALSGRVVWPWSFTKQHAKSFDFHHLDSWQVIYIVYSIFTHLSGCLVFPVRLVWAIWHITDEVRTARFDAAELSRPYDTESEASSGPSSVDDKSSALSVGASSNASTLTPDGPLSRVSTPKIAYFDDFPEPIVHAIILPSYKEDMDTLVETLSVLGSHCLAKSSYDIYLAMEQRDPHAVSTARTLIERFESSFRSISYTLHPGDIVGEVAGKSSNVSWSARQLSNNYTEAEVRRNVIISVMDSDTHFPSSYFLLLTKTHREAPDRDTSLYTLPIIFDRNSDKVNALVRTADIFWCGAGLSGMYRGSSVKIPTSVYSVPMPLASRVGGWDVGPESIGEDMHMFLKCYFATKSQVDVKIIFTPASQCNVSSDGRGIRGFFTNTYARYSQALRHMWGSLDTGYAVERGLEAAFQTSDGRNATWLSTAEPADRLPQWIHDSNLTHFLPPNTSDPEAHASAAFRRGNLVLLFHRLYEAHFLPAHLTVALFSAVIYSALIPPAATHPLLQWSFGFCGTLRFIGLLLTCCYLGLYESYHRICVRYREDDMKRAGLYLDMLAGAGFAHRCWRRNWIDYTCLPLTGMLFGTIPALVAYANHFFTDQLLYQVSAKPLAFGNSGSGGKRMLADRFKLGSVVEAVGDAATGAVEAAKGGVGVLGSSVADKIHALA